MKLTCHKCRHTWEEKISGSAPGVIQCPECMVLVPLALAKGAAPAPGKAEPGPSSAKTSPPAPERPVRAFSDEPPPRPSPARPAPKSSPGGETPPSRPVRAFSDEPPPRTAPKPSSAGENPPPRPVRAFSDEPPSRPAAAKAPAAAAGGPEPLGCNKCKHQWTEEIAPSQGVAQCPECMALVPVVVARQSAGAGGGPARAKPEAPARPARPAPATPSAPKKDDSLPPMPRAAIAPRPVRPREDPKPAEPRAPLAPRPPRPAAPGGPSATGPAAGKSSASSAFLREMEELIASNPPGEPSGSFRAPDMDSLDPDMTVRLGPEATVKLDPGATQKLQPGATQKLDLGKTQRLEPGVTQKLELGKTQKLDLGKTQRIEPGKTQKIEPEDRPRASRRDLEQTAPSGPPPSAAARGGRTAPPARERDEDPEATLSPGETRIHSEESRAKVQTKGARSAAGGPARTAGAANRMEADGEGSRGASAADSAAETKPKRRKGGGLEDYAGMKLRGYVVERKLGAGGMGVVCLARQVSLDRLVALKMMPPKFAANPEFLMRFTREALSAAQLNHHNIVQVYDVGSDQGTHFISMEFVRGQNLGDLVRDHGKLDLETAAGYILQSARGLKYAHDRGIIHRDIKPDNLMLNEHGVIKIADMGLAKMRGREEDASTVLQGDAASDRLRRARGDLTLGDIAMGTPAFMPPEQARDAAGVDHRADQYSLGCTFYYLCAGKAPFTGDTAMELISKHLDEAPPPLKEHVRHVPPALNSIISKMLEKDPDARYGGMDEVIKDLELFLGVASEKGAYTPREQHVQILEDEQLLYYNCPGAGRRALAIRGFFALMGASVVGLAFVKQFMLAGAALGLLAFAPAANFILDGLLRKTYLFRRVRAVFFGMTLMGWAWTLSALGLGALALALFPVLVGVLLGGALLSFGAAFLYQTAVVRPLRRHREAPLQHMEDMLKQLRIRGVPEESLHDFVYRYSGENWEEFFEDLFGYGPMILARMKWAAMDRVKPRKRFATWRDPIARWLDEVEESRRRRKEMRELAKVEAERLKAKGLEEKQARRRAEEMAREVVEQGQLEPTLVAQKDKDGKEKAPEVKIRKDGGRRTTVQFRPLLILFQLLQLVRLFGGAAVAAAWTARKFAGFELPLPDFILRLVPNLYTPYAAVAGALLVVAGLSRGFIMSNLVLLGAILYLAADPIVGLVSQPLLTSDTAFYAAFSMMGLGLFMCFLSKTSGGDF